MDIVEIHPNRWLDLPKAAVYCSLAVKTLRRAIATGDLAFSKPGRKQIVDRKDLDAWLLGLKTRFQP
jgi:excisionase family DNA binding protein